MRKHLLFSFLAVCLVSASVLYYESSRKTINKTSFGKHVDSKNINDFFRYLDKETLIVFDLDGVITRPGQTLGCDSWAYYEGGKFIRACEGDITKGMHAFCPTWVEVQNKIDLDLVDENFPSVLEEVKRRGNKIIGLTARGIVLHERTKEQLNAIGVDLEDNNYHSGEVKGENFYFNHGVVFVEIGVDKGTAFKEFLTLAEKTPKKILFIDDRMKNLKSIGGMCEKEKIDFVGFRYAGADDLVENFKPIIGDIQLYCLRAFDKVLSDEKAQSICNFFKDVFEKGGDLKRDITAKA